MRSSSEKAILYFARSPRAEAHIKRWSGDPHRDLQIAEILHRHTLFYLRNSGFDVIEFNEELQRGSGFADRFYNAIRDVFDMGYRKVIAVGNDRAGIETTNWQRIGQLLDDGQTIIGPDCRGGIYLLGLSRIDFERMEWSEIPWKQPRLFSVLISQFPNVAVLDQHPDLNTLNDILKLLREDSAWSVIRILLTALRRKPGCIYHSAVKTLHLSDQLSGRAPPLVSAA